MSGTGRAGFSLVEITVALALLTLVVALLLNTLSSHQKVFRGMRQKILVNEQLRDGESVLVTDIRSASLGDTLRLMSDSAVEFFATIGSSVACTSPAGQLLSLVPTDLAGGHHLSSIPVAPDTGDIIVIYAAPDSISGNRRWLRFRIASVSTAPAMSACPQASGFTASSDMARSAYRISVIGDLAPIAAGAPVRFVRRGRYSLYRTSDGNWYLGYKRCNAVAAGCGTVQPVAGPYLPYAPATGGGLHFRFLDSSGGDVPSTRPLDVAAMEIVFRAEVSEPGRVAGRWIDSVLLSVTLRNVN